MTEQRYLSYHDALSDRIAKPTPACFPWGITHASGDMLHNEVSHCYVCVKQSARRGIATCRGSAGLAGRASRVRGDIAAIVSHFRAMCGHPVVPKSFR